VRNEHDIEAGQTRWYIAKHTSVNSFSDDILEIIDHARHRGDDVGARLRRQEADFAVEQADRPTETAHDLAVAREAYLKRALGR
jgi:hypothetical protein